MLNLKLIVLTLFVVFLNIFFFHSFGNLGFVFLSIGFFFFIFFNFHPIFDYKKFIKYFLPIAPFSLILLFRANGFVIFITVLSILVYLASCVYVFSNKFNFFQSWLEFFFSPFRLFVTYLKSLPEAFGLVKQVNTGGRITSKTRYIKIIIKGAVIASPILVILISLLTAADPVYGRFINNLFNIKINWSEQIIQRIIFSGIIFLFLLPLLYFRENRNPPELRLGRISLVSEMAVVMFLVALTLLSFLIVQFPYIFVSVPRETDLAQFGVKTYSEYVRRGFFELLFVAILVYGTVLAGLIVWRNNNCHSRESGNPGLFLKVLQLAVLSELLIFIFSLYRRIWLYQSLHGWSLVRIYGGIFLFWLAGFTISLALRHLIIRRWVFKEIAFTFFVILFLGFFNAEDFIATSGHPPTVNGRIDYVYLSRMSSDGYAGWKMAYTHANEVLNLRGLQNKNLINRDERREVAYAGRIVYELSKNYRELAWWQDDKNKVIKDDLTILNLLKQEEFKNRGNNPNYQDITEMIDELNDNTKISTSRIIYVGQPESLFHIDKFDGINLTFTEKSTFFYISSTGQEKNIKFPEWIDIFLKWRYFNRLSYDSVRQYTTIDDLITLQKKYKEIFVKISNQPVFERDWEFDISLDSPFVD